MKSFFDRTSGIALLAGVLALIILPVIWSAVPTKKRASEDMTVYGSPQTDYKAETFSLDFPDTTTAEICNNVGTLLDIHIHVPTTLTGRRLTLKMKDTRIGEILKECFKDDNVEIRYEGKDVFITEQSPRSHDYPGMEIILRVTLVVIVVATLLAALIFFGRFLTRSFVERQQIDLGRTLGLVFIVIGLYSIIDWLNTAITGTPGELATGGAQSILLGLGFWQHRKWARVIGLIGGWLGAVAICAVIFVGQSKFATFSVSIGGVKLSDPSLAQKSLVWIEAASMIIALLTVLHSKKAQLEFSGAAEPHIEPSLAAKIVPEQGTPTE